jgi:uncharacterized protein YqjF (DUF2071 family)
MTWFMYQGWRDLLFMSWPVPAADLARLLPAGLPVDTFEGSGWVSLVPFHMSRLHLRWLPPIPGTGSFPEINLRAYVRVRGEPGVFFFSIDADSRLGAIVAGLVFHLPFRDAAMSLTESNGTWKMTSRRRGPADSRFVGSYRAAGHLRVPAPGTLPQFLLERYASFQPAPRGRLYRGPLQHSDWRYQDAEAEVEVNTLVTSAGLALPAKPVCHFSPGVDTYVECVGKVDRESA